MGDAVSPGTGNFGDEAVITHFDNEAGDALASSMSFGGVGGREK
jgi:hypothetical protein